MGVRTRSEKFVPDNGDCENCRRMSSSDPKTVSEEYRNFLQKTKKITLDRTKYTPVVTLFKYLIQHLTPWGCKKMYGTLDRVWMEYNLIHVGVVDSSTLLYDPQHSFIMFLNTPLCSSRLLYVPQHSFMFLKVPLCCVCVG